MPDLEVRNPSRRSEVVGTVREASAADVDAAARAAAAAQRGWAAEPAAARADALVRAAARIEASADELGVLLAREAGVPVAEATREAGGAAHLLRAAAELAATLDHADEHDTAGGGRIRVGRRPLGVVAGIVPWNAPLGLAAQKVGPALVAGNAVIVKPSPLAPLAVTRLLGLLAGELPEDLLSVVNGAGETGSALIAHPVVRKVSFTGGGETARHIMRAAADRLTRVHFELGGNDPAVVLDDADLDLAAERIAQTAFRRAGQICYAVKRVYVPERAATDFTDRLRARVDALAIGDAVDPRTTMGPVNNARQFESVSALAERTRRAGRSVLELGAPVDETPWEDGWYLRPALVPDADHGDELVTVEQFGPLLPVVSYRSEDDAIAMANDSEYGLGSSVWSADPDHAFAVASRIEAGVTFVNGHVLSPDAFRLVPFGGVKQSGIGWENSPAGLDEYLEFHSIDVHPVPPAR
ncbi:aldehyde dehydrogenase family protein [Microbacterium marinilacus]|uniref:Aldehyde dehydrogenase family protein n=1 Tax=Microbacterium marinilacus TaxID=415209 RepID=A0ABP7BKC3_9MICO|nr:aldehyde dehydrogenase family protein [Microbacterium marinilacus]MBY0689753.1 aldehyde dehydrogenase family protein [Microbacterium marinilacus]